MIAPEAFLGDQVLQTVEVPEGLRCIEDSAFEKCINLENINMPDSLKVIGGSAFDSCKIQNMVLPDHLVEIGPGAFFSCRDMKYIQIPKSVIKIGQNPFMGTPWFDSLECDEYGCKYGGGILLSYEGACSYLKIQEGTRVIPYFVPYFLSDNKKLLEYIDIPDSVTHIGNNAFWGCINLKKIKMSKGVISIGGSAFESCLSLEQIELPEGLKYIGSMAFSRCESLTEVILPTSVIEIGGGVFMHCKKLKTIKVPKNLRHIDIYKEKAKIIYY